MDLPQWLSEQRNTSRSEPAINDFWLRTPMGLENQVYEEVRSKLDILESFQNHRNVFVRVAGNRNETVTACKGLSTADDVFDLLGVQPELDHTKATVGLIKTHFEASVLPDLIKNFRHKYLRVTLSFVGKRNFSRFVVEETLNEVIGKKSDFLPLSNEQKDARRTNELRLRYHLDGSVAFIGVGLFDQPLHRRIWRATRYPGQLHPPIAAIMANLLEPIEETSIIDPFCGSGTVLLESYLQHPTWTHQGFDVHPEAIEISQSNAHKLGANIKFTLQDAFQLALQPKSYILLCNPPWDKKQSILDEKAFSVGMARLINQSAQAVLILPDPIIENLKDVVHSTIHLIAQTRVRGQLVWIVKVENKV